MEFKIVSKYRVLKYLVWCVKHPVVCAFKAFTASDWCWNAIRPHISDDFAERMYDEFYNNPLAYMGWNIRGYRQWRKSHK